jgi:DNA-binding CsgD family transcriptional regulator
VLLGRAPEERRIDELLSAARGARSGTLVLVGDPGIGKTALLDYAEARGGGFEVLRARGVESEAEIAFAALFEICRPVLDRLERLERQQQAVLRATFGIGETQRAPAFAIGAATLALLAAAAEDRPLLLLVDDAHWLDRASADALAFALRRLRADAVAALFATRPGEGRPFSGRDLPELELRGLDEASARELLQRASQGALPPDVVHGVLESAAGNPLALLELPRQLDSIGGLHEPIRLGKKLERAFAARAEVLRPETRTALLVGAVSSTAELDVLQRALRRVELSLAELEPAESAGLVSLARGTLAFRHPLVRSALYHAADPVERRRAHAAVAAALDDDDRAVWHSAAAAVGPDNAVAGALERAAEAASDRAGFAAAAVAYERAARLSERRRDRLRRLAAAADSAWLAGRTSHALALIEEALAHTRDPVQRGGLLHTRGTIEHFLGDLARAHRTLEAAADLLVERDRHKACVALNISVGSALMSGEIDRAVALSERAYAFANSEESDQRLLASLARGASLLMAGRPEEGLPFLETAAAAFDDGGLFADDPRQLPYAALAAFWLGDAELMFASASKALEWAREHAAVAAVPFAARLVGRAQLITGEWRAARASLTESLEASRLSRQSTQEADTLSALAWLDAAQGRAEDCRRHVDRGLELAEQRNFHWRNGLLGALVLLELGFGVDENSSGVERFRRSLAERSLRDTPANSTMPDLIEALIRRGELAAAADLLTPFADEAERLGQPFPRAVASRCRGLLADDASYEEHFEGALELHSCDQNVFAGARTRLAYGERLRRTRRRVDAREQLRLALGVFERLEAAPWAERARAELRATGERLRKGDVWDREELTPQEFQIALVVAEGKTNRQAGAQLFLSPKTIEWHLGHIYRKLGVRSRTELIRKLRLPDVERHTTRTHA